MYAVVFSDASFPSSLLALDEELARSTRSRGCPYCGGALHAAHYVRKPRGGPWALSEATGIRHSLCCAREGCRRRTLPPSVRFLGRRVYLGAVVLLAAVLQQGPDARRVTRLARRLSVDRRTLTRWRRWWLERWPLPASTRHALAAFVPPLDPTCLPLAALERFAGDAAEQVLAMLRWLAGHAPSGGRAGPQEMLADRVR